MINKKKNKRFEFLINEDDFKYFQIASFTMGLTPSKLLRMLADSSINAVKIQVEKGVINLEDFKTIFNDKL